MKHVITNARRLVLSILLALACPALLSPSPVYAQIFWANFVSDAIGGANLDGTGATQAFISGSDGDGPSGVAVGGAYIYWTNRTVNAIGRANLDGTGADHDFITGGSAPTGIAVDGSYIYWANQNGHTIGRATLDLSEINHSFITGASGPTAVAVDGSHLYWANQGGDTIGRANLNGTGVDQDFITGASDPTGVAVNGSHIYWANDGADAIGRADLDGTDPDQTFITGAFGPYGMALDGSYVYWANRTSNRIGRANLDGTLPDQEFITTGAQPRGVALGPSSTLPVELVSFTATLDGPDAVLAWQTASETNNAGFEVERMDGRTWEPLGFVAGRGTTAEPQSYTYRAAGLEPGRHVFRLRQVDYDGAFEYSPEVEVAVDVPGSYALSAAYPNPFNPRSTFTLAVAQRQHVVVTVHDALGRTVATLFDGMLEAEASHAFAVDGTRLPSGTYLLRARGERFEATQHLILVK